MNIKKYLLENWKLKLLSLLLATMLWFVVYLIGETKKELIVPVSAVNLDGKYAIMKMDITKVDITLTGRVSVLKDIKESDIKVSVNVSNVQEGENIFNISKTNVQIPRGVQIDEIRPTSMKIDVDRIIDKKLKTVVRIDKRLSGEYDVESWSPTVVTVSGPRRTWEEKAFIETVPINEELKLSEESVTAFLDTEGAQASTLQPEKVKVILKRHGAKKTLRN